MKFDFYPFYKLSLKKGFASFEKKTFHPIQLKIYYSKTREKSSFFFTWQLNSRTCLKEECVESSHFILLLDQDFKVLIDNGDSQENASAAANRAQEVSEHRQGADAQASEGGGRRDVDFKYSESKQLI